MKIKRTLVALLALLLVLGLSLPAAAAKKGKKKGKDKGDKAEKVEKTDPMAGRIGLSIGGGGVSSSAGFGFEGRLGVTYYFNHWVNATLQPGFGTYPIEYNGPDDETETVYIKYIPTDLSVIFTPFRFGNYGVYFGPGVGMTYYWWSQKEDDPDNAGESREIDYDETLYSTFITGGVSVYMGGPLVMSVGATYTIPDVSDFSTENGVFSFGFSGGVMF